MSRYEEIMKMLEEAFIPAGKHSERAISLNY